jgi:hypothetical protein
MKSSLCWFYYAELIMKLHYSGQVDTVQSVQRLGILLDNQASACRFTPSSPPLQEMFLLLIYFRG